MDDVLTTGRSIRAEMREQFRLGHDVVGAVIFARDRPPRNVVAFLKR